MTSQEDTPQSFSVTESSWLELPAGNCRHRLPGRILRTIPKATLSLDLLDLRLKLEIKEPILHRSSARVWKSGNFCLKSRAGCLWKIFWLDVRASVTAYIQSWQKKKVGGKSKGRQWERKILIPYRQPIRPHDPAVWLDCQTVIEVIEKMWEELGIGGGKWKKTDHHLQRKWIKWKEDIDERQMIEK